MTPNLRPRLGAETALILILSSFGWLLGSRPAHAEEASPPPAQAPAAGASASPASDPPPAADVAPQPVVSGGGSGLDLFSKDTFTVMFDGRLVVANGSTSFVNGGLGKTRFQGEANGDFKARAIPVEADLVWNPRFSNALTANVSAAWQRDQEHDFDLIEAFVTYLPTQTGNVGFSARAGLMWPEISMEHSTGGAWTVVNTITPSAINAWVGEEVKVIGVEGTVRASVGQHEFSATGGVFGYNDTSGTLLSFRGWALHDIKATAWGHFELPPLNPFITLLQQNVTRSTIEIDKQPGWYVRGEWRPPWPFGVNLFYYDNRGDPEAFTFKGQWGWRTRFWNLGVNADIAPDTRLLAQGMTGSTIMGFPENGAAWVHTDFASAYVLVTHNMGPVALTGRIEQFSTHEHGSEMPNGQNSENGWAWTLATRWTVNPHVTLLMEAMNVRSHKGTRVTLLGLPSDFEAQTVIQGSVRIKFP